MDDITKYNKLLARLIEHETNLYKKIDVLTKQRIIVTKRKKKIANRLKLLIERESKKYEQG